MENLLNIFRNDHIDDLSGKVSARLAGNSLPDLPCPILLTIVFIIMHLSDD
jgi:hypothetical protein